MCKRTKHLDFLGTSVNESADAQFSFQHRLSKVDACTRANLPALRTKSKFAAKLRAWFEISQAVAVFNTAHLPLTKNILSEAASWELAWLRRVLRLRRASFEGQRAFNLRTAILIMDLSKRTGIPLLVERLLRQCFCLLFAASPMEHSLLFLLLTTRAGTVQIIQRTRSYSEKKSTGLLQRRSGYRSQYADIFILTFGDGWESCITAAGTSSHESYATISSFRSPKLAIWRSVLRGQTSTLATFAPSEVSIGTCEDMSLHDFEQFLQLTQCGAWALASLNSFWITALWPWW